MFGNVAIAEAPFAALGADGGSVNVSLSGLEANSNLGTTTFVCLAHINPTGQAGTSALGTVTAKCGAIASLNTNLLTSSLGTVATQCL